MTIEIRYHGWVAFELVTQESKRILFDPLLTGDQEQGIPPSPTAIKEFDNVDLILVSHAATDHMGQAFEIMQRSKARLICDWATYHLAVDDYGILEDRIFAMVSGVQFTFGEIKIKALAVRHHSLTKTSSGFISAEPICYLIDFASGERIFFGGDSSIHSDFKLYGELYQPHLAMLGVGGIDIHGQSETELHSNEAALVAKWLGVEVAIPMHYRKNEGEEFLAELNNVAPYIKGILLLPGEKFVFNQQS